MSVRKAIFYCAFTIFSCLACKGGGQLNEYEFLDSVVKNHRIEIVDFCTAVYSIYLFEDGTKQLIPARFKAQPKQAGNGGQWFGNYKSHEDGGFEVADLLLVLEEGYEISNALSVDFDSYVSVLSNARETIYLYEPDQSRRVVQYQVVFNRGGNAGLLVSTKPSDLLLGFSLQTLENYCLSQGLEINASKNKWGQ